MTPALTGPEAAEGFRDGFARLRAAVGRVIVGQEEVVENTLIALVAGGHVLLEGVPAWGKRCSCARSPRPCG